MNPIFDTFSAFNRRRMEHPPYHKLWHRLLWIHDEAQWRTQNPVVVAPATIDPKKADTPRTLAASGDGPAPFKVLVVEFGADATPTTIHSDQLGPTLRFVPGRVEVTFTFDTPNGQTFHARGFWLQEALQRRLQDELNAKKFGKNELQRFLDESFATATQRHELLASAPELDGHVANGKGVLTGDVPTGIPFPERADFLRHHPLFVIMIHPAEENK